MNIHEEIVIEAKIGKKSHDHYSHRRSLRHLDV